MFNKFIKIQNYIKDHYFLSLFSVLPVLFAVISVISSFRRLGFETINDIIFREVKILIVITMIWLLLVISPILKKFILKHISYKSLKVVETIYYLFSLFIGVYCVWLLTFVICLGIDMWEFIPSEYMNIILTIILNNLGRLSIITIIMYFVYWNNFLLFSYLSTVSKDLFKK